MVGTSPSAEYIVFLLVYQAAFLIWVSITCSLSCTSGIIGEFFELLEELVAIWEVHLPELLPLGTLDLFIHVLPEPRLELRLEVLIGGV